MTNINHHGSLPAATTTQWMFINESKMITSNTTTCDEYCFFDEKNNFLWTSRMPSSVETHIIKKKMVQTIQKTMTISIPVSGYMLSSSILCSISCFFHIFGHLPGCTTRRYYGIQSCDVRMIQDEATFSTLFGQSLPEKRMEKKDIRCKMELPLYLVFDVNDCTVRLDIAHSTTSISLGHAVHNYRIKQSRDRTKEIRELEAYMRQRSTQSTIQTIAPQEIDSAIEAELRQWNTHFGG